MAKQTATDAQTATDYDYDHDVDDVLGQRIFNPSRGMGLGVAIDARVVSNGRGDERYVFECATEPGAGTTLRDVDDVLDDLDGNYELSEDPWGDER